MSGNIFEWCQNWYGDYSNNNLTNLKGSASGFWWVMRGGSWLNDTSFSRVSYRKYYVPDRSCTISFRLVCP